MDLRRLRPADHLTGAFGLALLVVLFLPWYSLSDGNESAWDAFAVVDLWLALVVVLALAVPLVTALRDSPAVPIAADVLCSAAAIVAVPLVVWRLLDAPGPADVAGGAFAGLVCTLGVLLSAWRAMRDSRAPRLRPGPEARTMPAPPAATPEPAAPST
jgi:cation transport ATPase